MKNLSYLITAFFIATLLSACGGGGGSDPAPAPVSTASYVGAWDITLSQDDICNSGVNSIPVSASITEGASGELTFWIVDASTQTVLATASGADASWTAQSISLNLGGVNLNFTTDASLTINTDTITGTVDYSYKLCTGTFIFAAARVNAVTTPNAPTTLTVSNPTATTLDLSWDNASNEWGYTISRMGTGDTDYVKIATVGMDVLSYTDSGLNADSVYEYSVEAYNNVGVSVAATASGTTGSLPVAPLVPTALKSTTVKATSIDIAWVDNSDNEDSFTVKYCVTPDNIFIKCTYTSETSAANSTSYSIGGLTELTSYDILVCATNVAGSTCSDAITVNTLALPTLPDAPSSPLVGTVTDSSIAITWKDYSLNEDNMVVQYCETSLLLCTYIDVVLAANSTSYTLTKLSDGTSYDIRVCAVNEVGSACSTKVTQLTVKLTAPAAPTDLLASKPLLTKTGYSVTLTWADNSDNESGFEMEFDVSTKFLSPSVRSLAADTTTITQTDIPAGTGTYYVRIKAVNAAGSSAYSNIVTVVIP